MGQDDRSELRGMLQGNGAAITLGLLEGVHGNDSTTQRALAKQLGIAVGLTNTYLKRCVKKGYIKITQAPRNRYQYYLTPKGFAEKGRLCAEYLSQSFNLFRAAREQYAEAFATCASREWRRVALWSADDLAEIALLGARDGAIEIVGVVDPLMPQPFCAGVPVVADLAALGGVDAVVLTDSRTPQASFEAAMAAMATERVLAPDFLKVSLRSPVEGG
jgi:DNA-binding MarR family transcriptional regulator